MNKYKALIIPTLLINNKFIINCEERANLFTHYFSEQCRQVNNYSVLPDFSYPTNQRLDNIPLNDEFILSLICGLNANKSNSSDGISLRRLLMCDESALPPHQIIFSHILLTKGYMWKLANLTPIFKKYNKQLIKNYGPLSLLPIYGKIFEKVIFKHMKQSLKLSKSH